jgi:DNA (cytosine-5)-methyltransferase 1
MNMHSPTYTVASLFCGAGGLDLGFERTGFQTVWANDIDKDACETHRSWSSAVVIDDDIREINFSDVPNTDIILGGFPCQGFSLAGPRKIDDKRNTLYQFFAGLVGEKQPLAFVAENVKGIKTLGDGLILEAIIADFQERGYNLVAYSANASDYGVPQDRERVFLVGFRKDLCVDYKFPAPLLQKTTLLDAIGHMPPPNPEDVCDAPYSSRYMSRNRRRDWSEVSFTIPAMAKQVALHPSSPYMIKVDKDLWEFGSGVTRRFSWREAALIQTFPSDLEFRGNLVSKYKQIGNAVPVRLAEVVSQSVKQVLDNIVASVER